MIEKTGIQATEPTETTPIVEDTSPNGPNYHDRIRSEPDFAVTQVQEKDRYIGKLHEAAQKYKSLEEYVDAVGSEEIVRLTRIGNQIENSPQKQQMLDLMNNVPALTTEEPEIYDPETKALSDKIAPEIKALQEQNQELQTRLSKSEAVSLKGALTENLESALAKFKDDPELLSEAQAEITRAVNSLQQRVANGDRSAADQMEQLGSAEGARVLRMMTIDIYDRYVTKKLEGNVVEPNGEVMRSHATDARTFNRSAPPTDVIAIPRGVKPTPQMVQGLMEQVVQKLGKDPRAVFGA